MMAEGCFVHLLGRLAGVGLKVQDGLVLKY
jgi:hypothetical protein